MSVVNAGDKVGDVVFLLAVQCVGDGEAEVVILDVADDLRHVFQGFGHFLLPGAGIGNDVGDMTLVGAGCKDRPSGIEIHMTGGADGVIRTEDGLEHVRSVGRGYDSIVNPIRCVMRELDQQQQLREGVVLERDAFIEPAFGNAEQLREEPMLHLSVKLVLFGSISLYVAILPEIFFQREFGQQEGNFVEPAALEIIEGMDTGFTDDGRVLGLGRNIGSGKRKSRLVGEGCGESFARYVVAVAEQPGKCDLAGYAVFQGADAGGQRSGLGVCGSAATGNEGKGHTINFGVFRVEMPLLVGGIAHATQPPSDHLFAKQLRAEGAHAQNMGDGVGIPTLGEHRDADHALDVFAELAGLAYGVHDLTEQIFVGQILRIATGEAGAVFGLEFFDFPAGDLLEFVAHGFAGFELRTVHKDAVLAL